jgi:hypothetical protein
MRKGPAVAAIGLLISAVTAAAEPPPPALEALLIDFAGSALQRRSALSLALEAGETESRARLDLPLRYGYFNDNRRLDLRLSAPVNLREASPPAGPSSLFGDARVLEADFTLIRAKPLPQAVTDADCRLVEQFRARVLGDRFEQDLAAGRLVFADDPGCTESFFARAELRPYLPRPSSGDVESFQAQLVAAWQSAYRSVTAAGAYCRALAVVPTTPVHTRYLPDTGDLSDACEPFGAGPTVILGLSLAGGERERRRIDGEGAAQDRREYPWAANLNLGWYLNPRMALTVAAEFQRFFNAGEARTLCDAETAADAPLVCQTAFTGGEALESPGASLEWAHRPGGLPFAYRLSLRYREEDDGLDIRLPIFVKVAAGAVDSLGAGVELRWDNERERVGAQFFIGRSFDSLRR